ncbi:hypothetical protein [Photobacterium kishitanii]|uniref:Uncharacterized protein n=1 Tax=Photobacterium kishitanii TaxID=318456 RepID=A0A2T3KLK4_9GAMM|nr:hypothetical protein [Photobacterium kishitanii]PSV00605.1 hypothetical protein C9J27_05570 [Photobacterium kishitanii]
MAKYKAATLHEKRTRVAHCNQLIESISSYGRRFFYNSDNGRRDEIVLSNAGRVYFLNTHLNDLVYTHTSRTWLKFSSGGTLRCLVEAMRDYVIKGEKLDINGICPMRIRAENGNIWGYPKQEAEKLISEIKSNPIFYSESI